MKDIKDLEKELSNFNFIGVHTYTKEPIYNLIKEAKTALYSAFNYFEKSEIGFPVIYTIGRFQVIIEKGFDKNIYTLQYVI